MLLLTWNLMVYICMIVASDLSLGSDLTAAIIITTTKFVKTGKKRDPDVFATRQMLNWNKTTSSLSDWNFKLCLF